MAADPKTIWRNQETQPVSLTLTEIRMKSEGYERRIRRRNAIEYAASAVVVVLFGAYAFLLPGLLVKLGSVLVIAGTLVVVWQLHRRASVEQTSASDCTSHLRGLLERQRDALRSVALWYLGPLVPGMAVLLVGLYIRAMPVPQARLRVLIVAGICVFVFAGVWLLNRWGAKRLQKQIDAL